MFEKYINYDRIAEDMLRSREDNLVALASLWDQWAEVDPEHSIGAIRYDSDPVQSSPSDDSMVNDLIRRESLKAKIRDLENERRMFDRAWAKLSDDEKQILTISYMQGLRTKDAINVICQTFYYERTKAYIMRHDALKHFKKLLFG